MTINHRFAAAVAFAFALGIATTDAAFAACGVSGEYCNGDPNHSAMDQLTHADEGLRDETFDGNQQGH